MQINNVGNGAGQSHHNMHQVTEYKQGKKVSRNGKSDTVTISRNTMEMQDNQSMQPGGGFSLASLWKKLLEAVQKLYISIWGEAKDNSRDLESSVEPSPETAEETLGAAEVAGTALTKPDLHNNPYFSAIEDTGKQKQTVWGKIRVQLQAFTGRNSFETGQQKPKQDMRKYSKYKQDDLEIDCILTDDSYLMDSYDKKGGYSQLSPKK